MIKQNDACTFEMQFELQIQCNTQPTHICTIVYVCMRTHVYMYRYRFRQSRASPSVSIHACLFCCWAHSPMRPATMPNTLAHVDQMLRTTAARRRPTPQTHPHQAHPHRPTPPRLVGQPRSPPEPASNEFPGRVPGAGLGSFPSPRNSLTLIKLQFEISTFLADILIMSAIRNFINVSEFRGCGEGPKHTPDIAPKIPSWAAPATRPPPRR